jgi:hypothetical protein
MFLTEHLYEILNLIKESVLDNNGIIFGSYVQNSFLNKHYSNIYYNLNFSYEKYWDSSFHLPTIERITIENYMNIHFNTEDDYFKLLDYLKINNISYTIYKYSRDILIEDYFELIIKIDHINISSYYKPLFLSECLIMYKNLHSNRINIEFSSNSGTGYDYLPEKDKIIIKNNIIADIYKKKTLYLYINIPEIYKYINMGWNIINMPYTILQKGSIIPKYNSFCCLICLEELFDDKCECIKNTAIIYNSFIKSPEKNYYPIHSKCLMKYILHKSHEDFDKSCFTCPYRFKIDFNNYKYLLNYDYYKLNKIKVYNI